MQVHLIAAGKFHDIDFARLELLAEQADIRTTCASDYADAAPGFTTLLRTRFGGHPPIAPFKVEVTKPHPLTGGVHDFRVEDELYLTHRTGDIDVLLHTRFSGQCPEFGPAYWDESEVPVLYERRVGAGAVLYLTLGHCRGHYDLRPVADFWPHPQRCAWNYPVFYELLRRGIRWGCPQPA